MASRLEKIRALKQSPQIHAGIDPLKCKEEELDQLLVISNKDSKRLPRSVQEWSFVSNLAESQRTRNLKSAQDWVNENSAAEQEKQKPTMPPIGKFK